MKKKTKVRTKRQAIVVLGMHRSGTSALSGTLSLLGCDAPNTRMEASDANAKGFFESKAVYELHRDLLDSAGSMWSDWNPVNERWFETVRAEEFLQSAVNTLEQEFGDSRLFFLKDPRVCRLVPFWLEALSRFDSNPLLLHIHRNPLDVVASLTRHHDLSDDTAMLLWLRHVLDAERFTRGMPRHFLSYDRFLDNWGREIARLQEGLGIILPRQSSRVGVQVNKFLESALRHFDTSPDKVIKDPGVAEWIRSTYEIMQRWATEEEDPADHVTLDRILAAFDEATPVMNTIITNREKVRHSLIKFETAETDLRTKIASLETIISEEKAKAAEFHTAAETLKTKQSEADLERAGRIAALESEIARTATLLAEANANWKQEQESAHRSALELETLEARLERVSDELELTRNKLLQREAELDSVRSDAQAEKRAQAALAEAHAEERSRLASSVESKRSYILELETGISERFKETSTLTRLLFEAQQTNEIAAKNHAREIARKSEELETFSRLVKDLESRIEAQEQALTAEKAAHHAERASREQLERARQNLLNSNSWRVTAPIRMITGRFRRS